MEKSAKSKTERFLKAWIDADYEKMLSLTQRTWKAETEKIIINRLKEFYPTVFASFDKLPELKAEQVDNLQRLLPQKITSYKIISVKPISEVAFEVSFVVDMLEIKHMKENKVMVPREVKISRKTKAMLFCEKEPFKPSRTGFLGLNPLSIMKFLE